MTLPALPGLNNTNWYGWAQALDGAVRTGGSAGSVTGLATGTSAGTANAAAIQAAINTATAAGGGRVTIPAGTWTTAPLVLKSRVELVGQGWGTTLRLANGANTHLIRLEGAGTFQTGIRDIRLDGNKANQTAGSVVYLDNTDFATVAEGAGFFYDTTLGDPNHAMSRVLCINGKEHGLFVTGSLGQGLYQQVFGYLCDKNGIRVEGPDNHFISCIVALSGEEGFYAASNSLRFLNCKSWLSGRLDQTKGDGYRVQWVRRVDLIGCESQDNRRHGYTLFHASDCHVVARGDRNGIGAEPFSGGGFGSHLYLDGGEQTGNIIDMQVGDRDAWFGGTITTQYAYTGGTGSAGNVIRINSTKTKSGSVGTGSLGTGDIALVYDGSLVARQSPPMSANTQTGTTYTLVLTDAGQVIESNNAAAVTVTIPPNSAVAFPVGTLVEVHQLGAGQVTIAPGAGVTLRSRGAALKSAGQYGVLSLRKRGADEWVLGGDASV